MTRPRLVIVGGGILGTMHAWEGLSRGFNVVQLEREDAARGASVRNFGLIWVSGRAGGAELALALRARELWEQVARDCPGTGFRANGSLTVATDDRELDVIEEAASRSDALARGFNVLDPAGARRRNPALQGEMVGALHCARDAALEPRWATEAIRAACQRNDRFQWLPAREVVDFSDHQVTDALGARHNGDVVVLCIGSSHRGLAAQVLAGAPVRRVRLQMLETAPFSPVVTTSVADGDSLRYYPAFGGPARDRLRAQNELAQAWGAQLLLVQRLDGALTIGDTHSSTEPFAFDLDESPYRHLLEAARAMLGRPTPPVARRWAGVYSQLTEECDPAVYLRRDVAAGVQLVTATGGRGMTLAPAIAEETFA